MITKRRSFVALILFLALLPPALLGQSRNSSGQQQEVLTNESIIKMVNAGLTAETIIRKIEASRVDFDLSTDGLIALKKANVPEDVIHAMQEKQSEPVTVSRGQRSDSVQPVPQPRWSWRHHCRCCW
ncbi:MAG: hypothetical protein N0A16_09845 [Blastocatellia bacterium]|nr:hypothetical protein [Blastocatellia bacterium]MCS7158017.1 hypothetical protein [Blastocatellia bacterium]MCX7752524.1 hypothetical protein [Blastocatellia bacterium]MDW8167361.1 hypothetical protein [Acidobacteriota bacterium]MDW8257314.1 hypothetical protein [Acidobacteriota bacterium]